MGMCVGVMGSLRTRSRYSLFIYMTLDKFRNVADG